MSHMIYMRNRCCGAFVWEHQIVSQFERLAEHTGTYSLLFDSSETPVPSDIAGLMAERAIIKMLRDRHECAELDENAYRAFLTLLESLLTACSENPDALLKEL